MVALTYETRSPDVLADEDDLLPHLASALQLSTTADLQDSRGWGSIFRYHNLDSSWSYPGGWTPEQYSKLVDVISTVDLSSQMEKFWDGVLSRHPSIKGRVERQRKSLNPLLEEAMRAYTLHMLETWKERSIPDLRERILANLANVDENYSEEYYSPEQREEVRKTYQKRVELVRNGLPPNNTFPHMQSTVDTLASALKGIAEPSSNFRNNIRVTKPVTYRGRNRILMVAEHVEREDGMEIIIHWSSSANAFRDHIRGFREYFGGSFKVYDRRGKLLAED